MTALATALNPSLGGEDEVLVFYCDSIGQLGFNTTTLAGDKNISTSAANSGSKGLMQNPSQIAAIQLGTLIRVFGVTVGEKDNNIALLSPGYTSLGLITGSEFGSLAACSNGEKSPEAQAAWIYYLDAADPPSVMQYDYIKSVQSQLGLSGLTKGTLLAACYDQTSKKPYVVCQSSGATEGGPFLCLVQDNNVANGVVTKDALPQTPIAVCAHPGRTLLHIYYVSNRNVLQRVSWSPENSFGSPIGINGPGLDKFTNISVIATAEMVHVFYIYDSNDSQRPVCHVRDEWFLHK